MLALHPPNLTLERLTLGELPEPELRAVRQHVAGCGRCQARLAQMEAQAASFSRSPHSLPARRGFAQADRAWKKKAMLVALAPLFAAAALLALPPREAPVVAPPAQVASVAAPPRPPAQARELLPVRPEVEVPRGREVRLRGVPLEVTQGALEGAAADGAPAPFVLKHTTVEATLSGFVSSVTVTQEFENPFAAPVEALYVFPLPDNAAVDAMTLETGSRVIRARIETRQTARQQYEEAKAQGRRAALLDQERPNIFTQSVANLLPGEKVKVTLHYVAALAYDDGAYSFNFPMVVGPRYLPGAPLAGQAQGSGTGPDTTRVLDGSRISPPLQQRVGQDITVRVQLDAGAGLEALWSASHRMLVMRPSAQQAQVELAPEDRIPNKDFILRWKVAGAQRQAALLASGGRGGTFALMVTPPESLAPTEVTPKEMVFLIDTSCSMAGEPLEAAKRAMGSAMEQMNPDDTFLLLDFADRASSFHAAPLANTPANVARARSYLKALPASGGTNQLEGIRAALLRPADPKRLRMVLLMTDGFIGNEREIFSETTKALGSARLFGFGIGSSVNHHLLGRLSELGRGFYQYVRPDEDPQAAVARFVRRLERPVLTDVEVDWGGLTVTDLTPARAPDLFDAQPLVLMGRVRETGRGIITLRGKSGGRPVETKVEVNLPEQDTGAPGLSALWARARIEALERTQDEGEQADVVRRITTLGLEYHLVTAYTSLVAVEQSKVSNALPVTVTVPSAEPELTNGERPLQQKRMNTIQVIRGSPPATPRPVNQAKDPAAGDGERKPAANKAPPELPQADSFDLVFGGVTHGTGAAKTGEQQTAVTPRRDAAPPSGADLVVELVDKPKEAEAAAPGEELPDGTTLFLELGGSRVLKVKGIQRIAVTNNGVYDVMNLGQDRVRVLAHGLGKASLFMWRTNGNRVFHPVTVLERQPTQAQLMDMASSHNPDVEACLAVQHKQAPNLHGVLKVRWTVALDGRSAAVVASPEFKATAFAGCMLQRIQAWTLPVRSVRMDPIDLVFDF